MKKIAIVALVLLIVLIPLLPLGMGMAMGACPSSHLPACPDAAAVCFALVAIVAFLPLLLLTRASVRPSPPRGLLIATSLEHPPRLR
jgi:hypothetical protein